METLERDDVSAVAGRRYVIAGGSGFLGLSLATHLTERGAAVTILSRSEPPAGAWSFVEWDGRSVGDWVDALDGADGLVNLAGRTVDCIKTPDHCDEILRSRVESTRVLGAGCRRLRDEGRTPPPVWAQMSTAHIYGDPPTAVCDESSTFGYGLAPTVAKAWEDALAESVLDGQREVRLRTSFVIGRDRGAGGGALATLARLARFGLGGRVGSGRQGFSWLHEADMNRMFERSLTNASMSGAYVASSPNAVSQAEFMAAIRKQVGIPVGLPTPEWLVRIGARVVLRTDPELAIYGRYVRPTRLMDEGYEFAFAELGDALADLLD